MSTEQEFKQAFALLNSCIANLACGVEMTDGADFYAGSLYSRCHKYTELYKQYAENGYNKQEKTGKHCNHPQGMPAGRKNTEDDKFPAR